MKYQVVLERKLCRQPRLFRALQVITELNASNDHENFDILLDEFKTIFDGNEKYQYGGYSSHVWVDFDGFNVMLITIG